MKIRKLRGKILDVEKTEKFITDADGNNWEKCIFTIRITSFSKRTQDEVIPENLKGKKVKLVRYCCFDWHYGVSTWKVLESDETEGVLANKPTSTVYW